jgi:hypothetical protein
MAQLRSFKKTLLRSNTRGVYKADQDDRWVADHAEIQRIAEEIERRRVELGKTSGFEKLYAKVTRLYFGGIARHLSELRMVLRPGAKLAYVVGDQASYLQVMIRTGQLLVSFRYRAELPQSITDKVPEGYEWVIRPAGRARYRFALIKWANIVPPEQLSPEELAQYRRRPL